MGAIEPVTRIGMMKEESLPPFTMLTLILSGIAAPISVVASIHPGRLFVGRSLLGVFEIDLVKTVDHLCLRSVLHTCGVLRHIENGLVSFGRQPVGHDDKPALAAP